MAKLNQIIAIEKGIKQQSYGAITELHRIVQKAELFNGLHKTYEKLREDGEDLPPESKRVQYKVSDVLKSVERTMTDLVTITARKDWTNCVAKGNITVDGVVIVEGVPATHLLFLEKQLTDLRTLVSAIPVLDLGEDWNYDANSGLHKSAVVKTHRTKKEQEPIVLYPATPEHPAQTQIITKDVLAGHWALTKHSGAMPEPEKLALLARVEKLLRATKEAREQANDVAEASHPEVARQLFNYLMPEEG